MEPKQMFMLGYFLAGLAIATSCNSTDRSDHQDDYCIKMTAPDPKPAAPDGDPLCPDMLINMLDCLPYLRDGSTKNKPGDACCSGAESVLEYNGPCICIALQTSSRSGYALNMTRVRSLSSICVIEPFPLDKCGTPVKTPEPESPTPAPAQTPDKASKPSCSDIIFDMIDCAVYLNKDSSDDQLEDTCCAGFKSVMDFSGECICDAIKSSSQLGIELNMTRVEELLSICRIRGYPLEKCGIELVSPSPIPPTLSPPKLEDPMNPRSKTQSQSGHSGCHSLIGSSFAVFVSRIAFISILLLHM